MAMMQIRPLATEIDLGDCIGFEDIIPEWLFIPDWADTNLFQLAIPLWNPRP